jgi:hypothetical protein
MMIAFGLVLSFIMMTELEAQAQDAESGTDFSMFVGYMLPNQIEGVTEILPLFGGRYAYSFGGGAGMEITGENAHAMGVDWTSFGLNFRAELPVTSGVSALVYAGPDLHYYIPINDTARRVDYGAHFGVAALMLVTDTLWLRSDLKLAGNPGTSLSLLFGLMFRSAGGG